MDYSPNLIECVRVVPMRNKLTLLLEQNNKMMVPLIPNFDALHLSIEVLRLA